MPSTAVLTAGFTEMAPIFVWITATKSVPTPRMVSVWQEIFEFEVIKAQFEHFQLREWILSEL
jgi:hypothetical protein